ncbi:hypothetical protein [Marseilla massiliensis]|uniref:hypothetical protein n=1 Tax=Marseilla massiliensis TaxID=1841864 RepID=UPI0020112629|nr:hypothetical protein [Marseilla massiliensis]MCL1610904.1 hypothetical protein [Marseilla massiliensis]
MKTERIELKDSGVLFDKERHEYWLGNRQLSGITGMLQRQLFPDEFDGIPDTVIKEAARYGTEVHESIELFDSSWINDGTQEVLDYISLCQENGLVHERSEYTVTDGENCASNIDKVYRSSDETFSLGDIKTYGTMTPEKLEKARWQLSIYAYFFELQNKDAKVDRLFILHIRNKAKADGAFDHISNIMPVERIPSDICKELLDADIKGEQFINPYSIPEKYREQEDYIRRLIQTKNETEARLSEIKSEILEDMESMGVKTWDTGTMRLTRKLPTTRLSFNANKFKADHPELDYSPYERTSNVSGSLLIAV